MVDKLMTVGLGLGTNSIQCQGCSEALAGRQAQHVCPLQGLCPFLLQGFWTWL